MLHMLYVLSNLVAKILFYLRVVHIIKQLKCLAVVMSLWFVFSFEIAKEASLVPELHDDSIHIALPSMALAMLW
jgi:hypothetical protein